MPVVGFCSWSSCSFENALFSREKAGDERNHRSMTVEMSKWKMLPSVDKRQFKTISVKDATNFGKLPVSLEK